MMDLLCADMRASTKLFPLVESPAAGEGLIAMKRREPGKIFPLNESPAAEEAYCNDEGSLEKILSAEQIKKADE